MSLYNKLLTNEVPLCHSIQTNFKELQTTYDYFSFYSSLWLCNYVSTQLFLGCVVVIVVSIVIVFVVADIDVLVRITVVVNYGQ